VLSALPALFLVFDGVIKLLLIDAVITSMGELGYPVALARVIGVLELVCVLIYTVPRTSIVGAILLTGFLGGAVASHARIESPLLTHTLFGTYVGLMIWGGLILRNSTLRALIRNSAAGRDARWA
jgi:DoxX-like protein